MENLFLLGANNPDAQSYKKSKMSTGGEENVDYSLVNVGTLTLENTNERPFYISIVICQNKIIVLDIKDDNYKGKVKIHRLHDGKFLDMLDSDSRPRDICLMDATTICVLHLDGLIEMASIKSEDMSPVFTRMKSFRLDGVFDEYRSVARVNDNIVVVGVKQDTMYWCIVSLDHGHVDTIHLICKESIWSCVTTKDIIYISCHAGVYDDDTGVYAFDILNPSQCKYKYKHERLRYPRSIVINEDGNIFVGNGVLDNSCIHQLTASCQLVAIFTEGIPDFLRAMFWDNGRLYVTCWDSPDITVFRNVYQEGSHKQSEFLMSHGKKQTTIVETSKEIEQGNVETGQSSEEMETHPSKQMPMDYGDDKDEGSHKHSEFLISHEKKQPIIVETSKKIEQGNVDKWQSNIMRAALPSPQHPKDSENGKQDQHPEEDTRFIECITESNFRKIGLVLKNRMVPYKSTIIHAIKEHGYNKGIQCLLRGMSNLLRKQIPDAIRVWSGYRTEELHTPVFVLMFSKKARIPEKIKFSEPYDDYEIVFRNEHTPNEEEERISRQSEVHANTINKEDMARVLDCIAKNTERLMNEHSNLSIIAASTVKAMGFNGCLSKRKLVESMSIVLYVPLKGIIPVGEKEFPKDIDGISTDVREGEFVFHGRKGAHKWYPKLPIGCRISTRDQQSGTLGGFVDLPGGKTGCITAAHVVLNKTERKNYVKFKKAKKERYNASLAKGQTIIDVYQPTCKRAPFGKVSQIAFEEGNKSASSVDAAVIEITDHDRTPYTGMFPSGNYPVYGFTKENPMMYNSGKTLDHSNISRGSNVVKYGCSTNITHGKLVWNGVSVRIVNTGGKSWNRLKADNISYPKFFNQMVVKSSDKINFSAPGDSGALVFIYHSSNRDLEAIGLLIGGSTHRSPVRMHIVTPIEAVFQQLGLENVMFKRFPDISQGEQNLVTNEIIYSRQLPESHNEISDTRINELKKEIKEATKLEINEKMKAIKSEMKEIQEAVRANTEQIKANTSLLEQTIIRLLSKPGGDAGKG